jgi:hypothetical protein
MYLSEVRNHLLRPLDTPVARENNNAIGFRSAVDLHFDKILFLNDVFFSPLDAVNFSSPPIMENTVQHVL